MQADRPPIIRRIKVDEHKHDKEHSPEIPPNLPEGAYRDEQGVLRDRDGNPIGPGENNPPPEDGG
jgi:hypothetical protein